MQMMTKKDYLRVAEAMRAASDELSLLDISSYRPEIVAYLAVARRVTQAFAESDPKFVANDFLSAAGIAGLLVKS